MSREPETEFNLSNMHLKRTFVLICNKCGKEPESTITNKNWTTTCKICKKHVNKSCFIKDNCEHVKHCKCGGIFEIRRRDVKV